ncbi:MAG: Eco57I restriction-modification methylase domain-containing protein [Candidatus Heimdallarchaeaceae archaeon]
MIGNEILNRKIFRNQNLFFSEYYLGLLLSERKITRNIEHSFQKYRNIYEWSDSKLRVGSMPSELIKRFIQPSFIEVLKFYDIRLLPRDSNYGIYTNKSNGPCAILKALHFSEELDVGTRKSIRFSKTFQFQEKLDNSDLHWGIITNGELLRLLRQGAPSGAWFEIDLKTLYSEGNENDFWLFLRLISSDAFIQDKKGYTFLDKVVENSRKEAEKVQENLGEIFQTALEQFVNSLLNKHPTLLKTYPIEKIHHDFVILFFRILVIFYAEARGILPLENEFYNQGFSLEGIRDFVEIHQNNFDPHTSYLWHRLKALFKLLQNGIKASPMFILEPFGSELFNPNNAPLLEEINPGDDLVGELILTFSLTPSKKNVGRQRISYRELDVEQIGSIYEQILDLQPKIAQGNLVIVKVQGGKELILSVERALEEKLKIAREIPQGCFYLSTWGGTRKLTGTYYTPKLFTRFLVENSLKPIAEGKDSENILKIKILDPAMGSGAFLVAACEFLANIYLEKRKEEGLIEEAPQVDLLTDAKRKIAENCLYGVDKNPRAVELAQLSLWLLTTSRDMPLAYLKHKLVCGDSLIGCTIDELDDDLPLVIFSKNNKFYLNNSVQTLWKSFFFNREAFKDAIKLRHQISSLPDRDIASIEKKEWYYKKLIKIKELKKAKDIGDFRLALWFLPEKMKENLSGELYAEIAQTIWEENESSLSSKALDLLNVVRKISEEKRFVHWEILFPEVFFNKNGDLFPPELQGFDVILSNPPWEAIKPLTDEFFSAYDPFIFNKKGAKKEKEKVKNKLLNNPQTRQAWDTYVEDKEEYSFYLRKSNKYNLSAIGELNTYRLFFERMFHLTKDKGKIAVFIHGGLYSDDRTKALRKDLFNNHKIEFLYGFENRKKLLKSVHSSFKFVILTVDKNSEPSPFPAKFMLHEPEVLYRADFKPVHLNPNMIKRFSLESLSIPEINKEEDLELLEAIYKDRPLIKETGFKLYRELDMTNDSDLFIQVSGWNEIEEKKLMPLYEGKMIEQFRADWEEPKYAVNVNEAKQRLGSKADFLKNYRLCVRSVASGTNYRTVIGSITFPNVICGNSITLFEPLQIETYFWFLAVLNSLPFDAVLRMKVSANINFHFVYDAPYLEYDINRNLHKEIISLSAILMGGSKKLGEKYIDLLSQIGLVPKPLSEEERKDMQAKLEALMLRAWEIPEHLIPYLLSRFPLLDQDYKTKILGYYENTKRNE